MFCFFYSQPERFYRLKLFKLSVKPISIAKQNQSHFHFDYFFVALHMYIYIFDSQSEWEIRSIANLCKYFARSQFRLQSIHFRIQFEQTVTDSFFEFFFSHRNINFGDILCLG